MKGGSAARLGAILGSVRARGTKLTPEQSDAYALWASGPWEFLTGVWPLPRHAGSKGSDEPRPIFWTVDPYENRRRPFPHYDYLRYAVIEPIFSWPREDGPLRMVLDKPRQVLATTGILAGMTWEVLFREAIMWLLAKNKREESQDLVVEKMRFAYENLPPWLRDYRTIKPKPAGRFRCLETGSVVKAVGQNFGKSEAKGSTADVFIDEAVLLTNLKAAWEAAGAMARRMVAVATPPEDGEAVPESVLFFRELLEGRPAGELSDVVVRDDDDEDEGVLGDEEAEELGVM
jgi:hypothetical protein